MSNVIEMPPQCPRTQGEMIDLVRRNLGHEVVKWMPELEARRELGAGFRASDLEEVPGLGPCVMLISAAGAREMVRIASLDPRKRAAAADLSRRLEAGLAKRFGPRNGKGA